MGLAYIPPTLSAWGFRSFSHMLCSPIFREPTSSKDERYKHVVSQHLFPSPVTTDMLGSPLESILEPDVRGDETDLLALADDPIHVPKIHIELITIDAGRVNFDENQQATLRELNPDRRAALENEWRSLMTPHLDLLHEYCRVIGALQH